jgi:hypothetical protein
VISLSAIILLYFHTLFLWHSAGRHLAVFMLPAFVFMGAGIERCHSILFNRFGFKPATAYAILCGIILITFAPKILRANFNADKLIFTEIGHYIAKREAGQRTISVCGAFKQVRDVHFYANVDTPWAPCFDHRGIFHRTNPELIAYICKRKFDYFVWDQAGWQNEEIDSFPGDSACAFNKITEWHSQDLGKLILYEIVK